MPDLAGNKVAYFSFAGVIDSNGASKIAAALNSAVNGGYDSVHLCFNSPGGYVGDGIFLYNHIRGLPISVTAYNIGTVSSIGVVVFLSADTRYCSKYGMFMIHPTTVGPFGEGLPWTKLDSNLKSALAEDVRTEKILRERTRLPDNLLADRRFREVYLGSTEALQHGLVDAVEEFTLPQGNQIIQI